MSNYMNPILFFFISFFYFNFNFIFYFIALLINRQERPTSSAILKAFLPSKCQVPNHSWVDWWGWWEADGKSDGKIAWVGLQLRTSGPEPRTQPLHHTVVQLLLTYPPSPPTIAALLTLLNVCQQTRYDLENNHKLGINTTQQCV